MKTVLKCAPLIQVPSAIKTHSSVAGDHPPPPQPPPQPPLPPRPHPPEDPPLPPGPPVPPPALKNFKLSDNCR